MGEIRLACKSQSGKGRQSIRCDGGQHRSAAGMGLAAFGQPGVEAVIDILNRELQLIMRQAGTPRLASITREHVIASLGADRRGTGRLRANGRH